MRCILQIVDCTQHCGCFINQLYSLVKQNTLRAFKAAFVERGLAFRTVTSETMDPRKLLLACGLLLAVTQISGSPCTVCDGNHGEDVCSCAQQVVRPPLVLPPRRRAKKPKTPECTCAMKHVELPRAYVPKAGCSCQNHHQAPSEHYEDISQDYKHPQNYGKNPQNDDTSYQHYDKHPQPYESPSTHYDQGYQSYNQDKNYFQGSQKYEKEPSAHAYRQDDDDYDDDKEEGHAIYKRSLGGYGGLGNQQPNEDDDGVTYYPVGLSRRVGVDATSRMLARQLEKKRGKSGKEDGLIFGPRTVPVDGEVKPVESNVNEGGLQEYDREILELKSSSTGFSEEDEGGVEAKKLITYSQIGYHPSNARVPDFLRRIPVKPQLPQIKTPILPPLQYLPRTAESSPPESYDGYHDEYPQHHEHFQRFIRRLQEAHKTAKKPYFGEKKYY